jgi:glyoxylase-like metal-dependent hydrolase (beta-lactamase superfamily II)
MRKNLISIRSFKGGFDDNLVHLVTETATGEQFLVDAALRLHEIQPYLKNLKYIGITHTHGDHIAYLRDYLHHYPEATVAVHEMGARKINAKHILSLREGSKITLGNVEILALHTPGHYPDSVCFLVENALFTGDTLFIGRTGRTISPGSDVRQLYRSVYQKILTLPKSTMIYPGHDYGPQTTATLEKDILLSPLLQAENETDFVERMAAYEARRLRS